MRRRLFLSQFAAPLYARAASRALKARLEESLTKLRIVDTHEHILPEKVRVAQNVDFFTLAGHYTIRDIISAGLSREDVARVRDPKTPMAERWRLFEPYWKAVRFTGYAQCLRLALRDIYGIEEVTAATIERLNQAIAARNKPGLYREVLQRRAGIAYSVLDQTFAAKAERPDPEFFAVAARFDRFITARGPGTVRMLEELAGTSITDVASWKRALEKDFQRTRELGMVAVKCALAYRRPLNFEATAEAEAQRDFEALMRGEDTPQPSSQPPPRPPFPKLEDHLFHHLVSLVAEHRLPMQIHTGLLSANQGYIPQTNPVHLTNVFNRYPQVAFDLFHIGYPYVGEMAVLGKFYPNVHIDFCWAHIVAPHAAQRALDEFLETVPATKIMGFGGDFDFPELTYAHAVMARRNIAEALAARVERGEMREDEAAALGRMLLCDNPARLFPKRS
jgi:hypothetical protein